MPVNITSTWLNRKASDRGRPSRVEDHIVTGRRGLIVRCHPTKTISFRFRYKRQGKTRYMVLGEYQPSLTGDLSKPQFTLADAFLAREEAERLLTQGIDPIEYREAQRAAEEARVASERRALAEAASVRNLIADWAWHYARPHRKRPLEALRILKRHVAEPWGDRLAKDITRRDAVELLRGIKRKGFPVMANRVAALLTQVWQHGVENAILEASPLSRLPRQAEEVARDRVLTRKEIKTFWEKLETAKMDVRLKVGLRLLLVTGQRRGELSQAGWNEFNLKERVWTIPAKHSKNGKPHTVPLSPLAIELLQTLKTSTGSSGLVLPTAHSKQNPGGKISERALTRAVRNNEKHFGIEHFTPHDLRRTAASFMTQLGVPRLHVEKVLNHTISDVAEIYDRHDYAPEKQTALNKWAAELERIVAGRSNVMHIQGARVQR